MYRTLCFLIFFLVALNLPAQKLHYTVDLRQSASGKALVTLDLDKMGAEVVYFQMPAWAPGAYAMTNYGRFVEDFKAIGHDGKEKPTERINENRWHIRNGKDIKTITYSVHNSYTDSTSLYFALAHFDTSLVFASATSLFGYVNDKKELPYRVTYLIPGNWQFEVALPEVPSKTIVSTGTRAIDFTAKNYDELVDAPIMAGTNFQNRSFTLGKCRFDIVLASEKPFAMDSLALYTKKIVESQLDFFRDTPFVNYKFLINAPMFTNLPRTDQGALEHANSSAYLLVNVPWQYIRDPFCRIIAHEFFHAWNVKRIHSSKLGPFDYTKAVQTKELWMAEGVTDYYAHLLLVRYGILPFSSFKSSINSLVERSHQGNNSIASLEELSLLESEFDINRAMQFYIRGPLTAFALDLLIRRETNNRSSLDSVMITLNKRAKKGIHYTDEELPVLMTKLTGVPIGDFYKKYIAGTEMLSICDYLETIGMTCGDTGVKESIIDFFAPMPVIDKNGATTTALVLDAQSVPEGFSEVFSGGEILVSVNDILASPDNHAALVGSLRKRTISSLVYKKDGKEHHVDDLPAELLLNVPVQTVSFSDVANPTPLQRKIQQSLFTK